MARYTRPVGEDLFAFGTDVFTSEDYTESADVNANSEDWTTVAYSDISRGQALAHGRGETTNPQSAEGFIYADIIAGSDSDASGSNDVMQGRLRFVVLNPNREVVGEISRHNMKNLRSGSAAATDRQDRQPYPRQRVRSGKAEVGHPYMIGIQIQLADSYSLATDFDLASSTFRIDGHRGRLQG